jgi:hypothetical protein
MPIYAFKHKETGEVIEKIMKISDRDAWVEANPEYQPYHDRVNLGDPIRMGITQPPSDFQKGVIDRIKHSVPNNTIGKHSKFKIPKEY